MAAPSTSAPLPPLRPDQCPRCASREVGLAPEDTYGLHLRSVRLCGRCGQRWEPRYEGLGWMLVGAIVAMVGVLLAGWAWPAFRASTWFGLLLLALGVAVVALVLAVLMNAKPQRFEPWPPPDQQAH